MSSKIQQAQKARRARKKAARKKSSANLLQGRYTAECIRCEGVGPAKVFAKRVRVCNNCWKDMTPTERENIRGFASMLG